MPAISVVMPCHNRAFDLIRTLRAYDSQVVEQPFEMIAIDDASSDETYELLASYRPERFTLRTVRQETNLGPAAARNRGISLAKAALILFVGDDILPDTHLIRGHLTAHRFHPKKEIAILGRVLWPADLPVNTLMAHIDGIGAQQFSYHYFQDSQQYDYRHLYTANVSLKREILASQDKFFDTDFQFAAFEDVELSYRLAKKGLCIVYSSLLKGYHYHYHNIWSFSERMYRAGLMACFMVQKHPETERSILGRKWPLRVARWRLLANFQDYPQETTHRLETSLLHLSSHYEWTPHPLLDHLYLEILMYFFFKGVIYGRFGETPLARRIHGLCAQEFLAPLAKRFNQENKHLEMIPKYAL